MDLVDIMNPSKEDECVSLPSSIDIRSLQSYHYADWQYEKIMEQIYEFEQSLDENTEVALQLASFGKSILINVSSIGYQNPDLICFNGLVNGKSAQLIQHISQINFLLLGVPKSDSNKPPHRIGFAPSDEKEG